ncbi:fungal-specific transcription factor domain-containing protein [Penicillium coprophilum]|uniref:fungal-specific transcription factor domain-containing protein n=1 Tax=Penicillium coprophilum TaxID=36646 RepID=UPI00238B636C|nr:fungal-specific transcription factor domain-containing protein [Penicillium coprophilum]KAJ5171287.1 fungal-specific transcription factor domain-containing protein [Penicillium coprophilum]
MRPACWTCRKRTIQCDRSDNPCSKCKKAGLECFETRPLRWVKGVAIRGKMRGHALEENYKVANRKTHLKLNPESISPCVQKSLALTRPPPFALQDPSTKGLDWSSRFYLDYYNIRIAKLFILYDSPSNPFRSLLAYAVDNPTLEMSIMAVAARHFANSARSFNQTDDTLSPRFINANVDALHFKKRAIKTLSSSLSQPELLQKDAIMATILLLIFLDILESGIDGWKCHLHGAEGLVRISQSMLLPDANQISTSDSGGTVEGMRRFVARQFSLVSTIGGALSSSKSTLQSCINLDEDKYQESIFRSFLGCPAFLLQAIRYFSDQRHAIQTSRMHDNAFIQERIRETQNMLHLTADFDCVEWASNSLQLKDLQTVDIEKLSLLSESYRTTTLVYGNQVLSALMTSTGTVTPDYHGLVRQLLDVIDALKCEDALFKCLLWPTFIAGLECQNESERQQVMRYLKRLWDLTCCLNLISASTILQGHWRQKNIDTNSVPDFIGQGWLLV